MAKTSRLVEYRLDIRSGRDAANELGDADTVDLFTEISRGVDTLLWKVEAHV